jgi:dolichol-phosphate mannosyltransferase
MTKISVVSPEYGGAKMVSELVRRIKESVSLISKNFEIILVNDASPDNTWEEIQKVCQEDSRVKGINLSRNFGQHYAISAGLQHAKGDWIVVMDCDLQDRPEEIPNLYAKAMDGYDIVYAQRTVRKDGFFKKLSSHVFHKIFDWLSGVKTDKTIANFGIYHSSVINEFNKMPEVARSFGSLINYLGFRRTAISVSHAERAEGKSSYTLHKLLRLSFDVIIANSNKPLIMTVKLGFCISILAFLLAVYNIIAHLLGIIQVAGFTTTVFSIWFVGGIILFVLGIMGLYISKIFDQVKGRQLFVIQDKINIDE